MTARTTWQRWSAAEKATLRRLYPTATWTEVRAALPGRTPSAIETEASRLGLMRRIWWTRGRHAPYQVWSATEVETLLRLYPTATWTALRAALPGRTDGAIRQIACSLKVTRENRGCVRSWTRDEEQRLATLYARGLAWSAIAAHFPERSEAALRQRLQLRGLLRPRKGQSGRRTAA